MLGSIEAGGTKFVCAVSDKDLNIADKIIIDTESPDKTLDGVFDFFSQYSVQALGIGCFGPIDIDKNSKTYGYIKSTPKLAWKNYPFLDVIKNNLAVPVAFNTDVNVAAYGEFKLGAAQGTKNSIYLTVGTGIGGGIIINGKIIETHNHPELGHIFIRQHADDTFAGNCPYHQCCLEGLASGPAVEMRWNIKPVDIPDNHKAWQLEAYYLAQAVMNYCVTLSPDMIILGGGIMQKPHLLPMIKIEFLKLLNGYIPIKNIDEYIVLPKLGNDSGIVGGLLLAKSLL